MNNHQMDFHQRCEASAARRKIELEGRAIRQLQNHNTSKMSLLEAFLLGYWLGRQEAEKEFQDQDEGFVEEDFT